MTKTPKRAPSAPPSRSAVVVLGVHRSGTSALAGVLGQLGCDLPQSLMPPNENNPRGYFESNKVYQFNDALLASAGSSWDDWQEFNPGWIRSQRAEEFRTRARAVLAEEFGTSPLFVLKDPRICRFAPFWLDLLGQEGCRPLVVCTHRNPLDVANSLARREGWPAAFGLLLWLRNVVDAEVGSRGRARCFTSYDRLMENWAAAVQGLQERLDIVLPRQSDSVAAEIEAFLSRDLQHFRKGPEQTIANPLLSGWIRESYGILERWATEGERKADHAAFDRIRSELNQAAPAFGRLVQTVLTAGQDLREAQATLGETKAEADGLRGDLAARQQALQQAQATLDETKAEADGLRGDLAARQQVLQQAQAALDETKAEADGLRGDLAARQQALQQAEATLAEVRQARQAAGQQAATAEAARTAAQAEVARLTAAQQAGAEALARAEAALEEAHRERDQLRSALEQRSHEAEQVGLALREREAALDATRRQQTADAAEIVRLSADLEAARRSGERFEHDLKRSERDLFLLKNSACQADADRAGGKPRRRSRRAAARGAQGDRRIAGADRGGHPRPRRRAARTGRAARAAPGAGGRVGPGPQRLRRRRTGGPGRDPAGRGSDPAGGRGDRRREPGRRRTRPGAPTKPPDRRRMRPGTPRRPSGRRRNGRPPSASS